MRYRSILAIVCSLSAVIAAGCNAEPSMDYVALPKPVNQPTVSILGKTSPQQLISESLGQIGTPAVPALSQALTDADPIVRIEACRALGFMGAKANDAVPALTLALNDAQEAVQLEAAKALGDIGEAAGPAVPRLMEMLRTKR